LERGDKSKEGGWISVDRKASLLSCLQSLVPFKWSAKDLSQWGSAVGNIILHHFDFHADFWRQNYSERDRFGILALATSSQNYDGKD